MKGPHKFMKQIWTFGVDDYSEGDQTLQDYVASPSRSHLYRNDSVTKHIFLVVSYED